MILKVGDRRRLMSSDTTDISWDSRGRGPRSHYRGNIRRDTPPPDPTLALPEDLRSIESTPRLFGTFAGELPCNTEIVDRVVYKADGTEQIGRSLQRSLSPFGQLPEIVIGGPIPSNRSAIPLHTWMSVI